MSPGRKATLEPASEDLAIQQWERLTALAAGKPATRLVTLRAKARVCRNAVMRGHAGCDKGHLLQPRLEPRLGSGIGLMSRDVGHSFCLKLEDIGGPGGISANA